MAKRGTLTHPKTMQLAQTLGIEPWSALGLLEAIWHYAAIHAPTGELTGINPQSIATAIYYGGDAACMFDALVGCRLVEKFDDGRVIIHDWNEHADQGVRRRLERNRLNFASRVQSKARHVQSKARHVQSKNSLPVASSQYTDTFVESCGGDARARVSFTPPPPDDDSISANPPEPDADTNTPPPDDPKADPEPEPNWAEVGRRILAVDDDPEPEPDPDTPRTWRAVGDLVRRMDVSATDAQIRAFIGDCRKEYPALTAAELARIIGAWPLSHASSPYAVMRRQIPALLRDQPRYAEWIENGRKPTMTARNNGTKEFRCVVLGGYR